MSLKITHQDSLFLEHIIANGVAKDVHYVVKQTPFTIKLSVPKSSSLTFTNAALDCQLLYDLEEVTPVTSVKSNVLDFTSRPSHDGHSCSVDFRVRALTTQHHNTLFLIRITLKRNDDYFEVLSNPIHSCSKQEQIRRKQSSEDESDVIGNHPRSTKRARSDEIRDKLADIQETLQRLVNADQSSCHDPSHDASSADNDPSSCGVPYSRGGNRRRPDDSSKSDSKPCLDVALKQLVMAYEREDPSSRPTKVRKVLSSLSPNRKQLMAEIGFVLSFEDAECDRLLEANEPFNLPPPSASSSSNTRSSSSLLSSSSSSLYPRTTNDTSLYFNQVFDDSTKMFDETVTDTNTSNDIMYY